MRQITAKTPGEAWFKSAKLVLEEGTIVKDEEILLKESLNIFLTVKEPMSSDKILRKYADPKMVDWMRKNFLEKEAVANWGYSYGQRFFDFDGIDQIAQIIKKLKQNPESKSATVTLMNPRGDSHHMPCIVALDFKIRKDEVMTTAFFRSQDVGKKMYADIICIGEIASQVASGVGKSLGPVNIHIVSLHAYEADWQKLKSFVAY